MVVSCKFWFNKRDLDDPNDATFGRMVYDKNNRLKVANYDILCPQLCERDSRTGYDPDDVQDGKACEYFRQYFIPAHPEIKHHLVWGWDGYNSTGYPVDIDVEDYRECGLGLIVRRFVVEIGGAHYEDVQSIWVVDCDPFYVNPRDCADPDDDISWPLECVQPRTLEGCGANTSPSNPQLGRPRVVNGGDDNCAMIAIDYKDDYLIIEKDACFKILRQWIVVDWCQYNPLKNPYDGRWEYLQVIKVVDKEDPVVSAQFADCEPADTILFDSLCAGHIDIQVSASDVCTPNDWLNYEYKIDLFNDGKGVHGTFDLFLGPLTKPGEEPLIKDNPYADDESNVLQASGYYPLGEHRIMWQVEDGCGNVAVFDTVFSMVDCKAPTPYCEPGIITVIMPYTEEITVWAKDLDIGSFDNCTAQEDLEFSFSSDPSDNSKTFNCDHIGTNIVQIWVTDAEGNQDYCESTILIQDNDSLCATTTVTVHASGLIADLNDEAMPDIQTNLIQKSNVVDEVSSSVDGAFAFDIPNCYVSGPFRITPVYDQDYLENVSTRDLLQIQKHLLGSETFTHPAQYVAADVSNDQKVSARDMITLRKLLLGIIPDLNKWGNTSWKFFTDTAFTNPDHPWPLQESIELNQDQQTIYHSNFTGLKIGDVTGASLRENQVNNRSQSDVIWSWLVTYQPETQLWETRVFANSSINLHGYQLTLPTTVVSTKSMVDNIRIYLGEDVEASTNVVAYGGHSKIVSAGEEIFRFYSTNIPASLTTDSGLQPEMYDSDLRSASIEWESRSSTHKGISISPNPFVSQTIVSIDGVSKDMRVEYEVLDAIGRRLVKAQTWIGPGQSEIDLSGVKWQGSGVYHFVCKLPDGVFAKKLLKL